MLESFLFSSFVINETSCCFSQQIHHKVNFPVGHYLSAITHGWQSLRAKARVVLLSCSLFLYFEWYFRNIVADTRYQFISLFLVLVPCLFVCFFFACLQEDRGARRRPPRIIKLLATEIQEILLYKFTFLAAINFSPHANVTLPSFGMKSKITGFDWRIQRMLNWSVAVNVASKYLHKIFVKYMITTLSRDF